ncbi:zinc-ribbon domain-containing protein [Blastococcus sp. SYSU DS0669]
MLLLFGFGTKRKHLGAGATRTCPNCHNTTQWSRIRQYRQFSLFFVPVARWKRRELEVCGVCGTAVEV